MRPQLPPFRAGPQIRYDPDPVQAALLLGVADAGITCLIGHLASTAV
jgi:hypothetical protein